MPGWGWLRLMLPPGWPGSWRPCGVRTVVPLPLRTLLPPRVGWPERAWVPLPVRGCVLPPDGAVCCRDTLPEGVEGRVVVAEEPPLLRTLLPPRLTWPLLLPLREEEGIEGWVLRWAGWEELRLTEPRPLVLPDNPELRDWEDGADIEEEGRLPPLLRELPPPDPPRELLPPLV